MYAPSRIESLVLATSFDAFFCTAPSCSFPCRAVMMMAMASPIRSTRTAMACSTSSTSALLLALTPLSPGRPRRPRARRPIATARCWRMSRPRTVGCTTSSCPVTAAISRRRWPSRPRVGSGRPPSFSRWRARWCACRPAPFRSSSPLCTRFLHTSNCAHENGEGTITPRTLPVVLTSSAAAAADARDPCSPSLAGRRAF